MIVADEHRVQRPSPGRAVITAFLAASSAA
jgi:hypothetical protein